MFLVAIWLSVATALAAEPVADPAIALRARYSALRQALDASPIQPGLHVESVDDSRAPRGDVWAVVDFPFATVAGAFRNPAVLCESLILHLNVQYCRGAGPVEAPVLLLALGRKSNQALEETHRIMLDFKLETAGRDYMRVELSSADGPLDTGNYLIAMELVALDDEHAFMHIRYAYTQGVLERNTMRYFLAFNAWLHSIDLPASQRFEASLERWFADTERFARQLHELPHDEYIATKRSQHQRQQEILQATR